MKVVYFFPQQSQTTPSTPLTPTRQYAPPLPDTPSKDITLEQEPHGAEFEVSNDMSNCTQQVLTT